MSASWSLRARRIDDRVIAMPVKKVTSVMFGGPNLDVLYVTSMAKPPLPRYPGDGVLRGSLFAIHDLGFVACRSLASPADWRSARRRRRLQVEGRRLSAFRRCRMDTVEAE